MENYITININELFVDEVYQRDLSKRKIQRLIKNWNEDINMPLLVSKRENGLYSIIDGQHRFFAIKNLGKSYILCKALKNKNIEEEAELFATTNQERKPLTAIEMFKANLVAKNKLHLKIKETVNKYGYELCFSNINKDSNIYNSIRAVGTLKRICERINIENLDKTLNLINKIWGSNKDALTGYMLSGVSRFINGAEKIEYFDEVRLIEKLQKKSPYEIEREGKKYKIMYQGEMEQNMALAIMNIYNDRLRNGRLQAGDVLQTEKLTYVEREAV